MGDSASGIVARTHIKIDAPIETVWNAMVNTKLYPKWNDFITNAEQIGNGGISVGGRLKLQVKWKNGGGATSEEMITESTPPSKQKSGGRTAVFSYQNQGFLDTFGAIQATRTQKLAELPGNRTLYTTEEEFKGWLAGAVPLDKVQDGFERQARALKQRAETLSKSRKRRRIRVNPAKLRKVISHSITSPFPEGIEVYKRRFKNWAGNIDIPSILVCEPKSSEDVVKIANWAHQNGREVRPLGKMHNWSPLSVGPGTDMSGLLFVDTTKYLNKVLSIKKPRNMAKSPSTVTVQAGILLDKLWAELESEGLGVEASAAVAVTLGGALSVGAHGTGVPARGEKLTPGHTFGSLSNTIKSFKAIVWDKEQERYVERAFKRSDPDSQALVTSLGATFLTEVEMRVGKNRDLHCRSYNIPVKRFCAADPQGEDTLTHFLDRDGRVEMIWHPYTEKAWIKSWRPVTAENPVNAKTKRVNAPYNFPHTDRIPEFIIRGVAAFEPSMGSWTPFEGRVKGALASVGIPLVGSTDIVGPSKNILNYVRDSTLRVMANGYAIMTKRENVQRVLHECIDEFQTRLDHYATEGKYPINGPVEARVSGVDNPKDAGRWARAPHLSAILPRPDHKEWDTVLWLDFLTARETEHSDEFYEEMEGWLFDRFKGDYAAIRPELSKGFAYTKKKGAWSNAHMLQVRVPEIFSEGQKPNDGFHAACNKLFDKDPHGLFWPPMLRPHFEKIAQEKERPPSAEGVGKKRKASQAVEKTVDAASVGKRRKREENGSVNSYEAPQTRSKTGGVPRSYGR